MELVTASPRIEIEFQTSFAQNLYTAAVLLQVAADFEGLSDWMRQTAGQVPPTLVGDLKEFSLLGGYTTGFWGELMADPALRGDIEAEKLVIFLQEEPEIAYRLAARRSFDRHLQEWELAPAGAALKADQEQLEILLLLAWQARQAREGTSIVEESEAEAKALASFFVGEGQLKANVLAVVNGVWALYSSQYRNDLIQIRRAVAYHRVQRYPQEFKAAFVAITGRTVPPHLDNRLVGVRRVVMAPTSHIGPYLLFSPYGETLYISFNANTAPGQRAAVESVATLYPPLKALADETRLQIVNLLTGGERYVGEIAELLDLSHSSASRHLNLLTAAEILDMRKENNQKYFRLNQERLRTLVTNLQELFHL